MSLETLIERLDGVKHTGVGRFMARCPAHDDRSPSLGVKDCGDGVTVVNCLAGCETEDVLSAIGLSFSDLYPERIGPEHSYKPVKQRFDGRQVLRVLRSEATLVAIAAENIAEGISLSDDD
jgi:hypothetical protein